MHYPFVYISALMRTGSTLTSEIVTELPYAYIFREPHIGKNDFQLKPGDAELIQGQFGLDLPKLLGWRRKLAFVQRRLRVFHYRQDFMVRVLKERILPRLHAGNIQIGVKEITHQGWQNYYRHFPDMKVIMLGRDPRDIYLSMVYRRQSEGAYKKYDLASPVAIAQVLNAQFQLQKALYEQAGGLLVTYEDLSHNEQIPWQILDFIESPLAGPGEVGMFLRKHPQRLKEYAQHEGKITQSSRQRWQSEPDDLLVARATAVFDKMAEYREFWGYGK